MVQGYLLLAIGKKYIDECILLVETIRKQKDNRPVSIVINDNDREYAEKCGIFDKIINFVIFDQELWNECYTGFEKFCLYPRLFLHKYICYDETIVIDSDVLCQYSPESIWRYLHLLPQPIVQLGHINDPSWHWGTINEVSEAFGKNVPHVHGGFFFIRRDPWINEYFGFAREMFMKYDEYKCKRWYQNGRVDEILFALAHAHFNINPIDFYDIPIMTFNIIDDMEFPTKLQTEGHGKLMDNYIPFIHMFAYKPGHTMYKIMKNKIISYMS